MNGDSSRVLGETPPSSESSEAGGVVYVREGVVDRPAVAFKPGERIRCPRCEKSRLTVSDHGLLCCDGKVGKGQSRKRCGFRWYMVASHGFVGMSRVMNEELQDLDAAPDPLVRLWELGAPQAAHAALATVRAA